MSIPIYLSNTLSGQKELFVPIEKDKVGMYVCGPTVYDRPHIGNARAAVVYDILYRLLRSIYSVVEYVRNITDIDDKVIDAAANQGITIKTLTTEMTNCYHEDVAALNCLRPTFEPRATHYIKDMVEMIKTLIEKGHAYVANEHVLFEVSTFPQYGALSRISQEAMRAGARVEVAPYKKNPEDFVLWKPSTVNDKMAIFDSPWGKGRPGWHIECSAMSGHYLGNVFDIHGGGADLKFPHHENEIAQSCAAHDTKLMARYWVHNGFLTINGEKMSKSLNNFLTVHDLLKDGVPGRVLRYFYLMTHYKKPIDYNSKAIEDSRKSLEKFDSVLDSFDSKQLHLEKKFNEEILQILGDDLNTPKLLALAHDACSGAKSGNVDNAKKLFSILKLLGLDYKKHDKEEIPEHIKILATERIQAKENGNWQLADQLRDVIKSMGYEIRDLPNGKSEVVKK